ncbi:cell wall hydrolase [Allosphingosinicella sp.]|jgi:spore germination cell wall hydrolase CwlJ-like protein|uniref:cell wall hydrolase n=1 Tax=Allosphingosinicella sp. TaxID=2823234 RepID=UPI002EF8AC15
MSRLNRAAGFAAATLVAVFGTVHAGPSRAWEIEPMPVAFVPAVEAPDPAASAPPADPTQQQPQGPGAPPSPPEIEPAPEAHEPVVRRSLAELVADHSSAKTSSAEHECLASAVYFESMGESLQGQLTVAEVVLNRARSGRFPTSVCGVVKQRGQFSFVRGGRLPAPARGSLAWRKAVAVAHIALEDLADGPAPQALFFHATRVKPAWRGLKRIAAIGNHIFYR